MRYGNLTTLVVKELYSGDHKIFILGSSPNGDLPVNRFRP